MEKLETLHAPEILFILQIEISWAHLTPRVIDAIDTMKFNANKLNYCLVPDLVMYMYVRTKTIFLNDFQCISAIPWRLPSNCVNMIQKWFCYERWRRRKENRNSFMDRYLWRTCLRERIAERNKIQAPKTWDTDYVQVEFFFYSRKKTALHGRKIPKSNPIFFVEFATRSHSP